MKVIWNGDGQRNNITDRQTTTTEKLVSSCADHLLSLSPKKATLWKRETQQAKI